MNNASHPLSAKIPAGIGILLITLIIVGAIILTRNEMNATMATTQAAEVQTTTSDQSYKDGTYTETGSYSSPAGTEKVMVALVIANSTVTAATVTNGANDPTASSYQSLFISGYKDKVVGKKISEINLTNVAGSSLTPKGFMDALHKIETDAKA